MDRMKKIKRQLSMTLRGSRTVEKNLNEPINIEENNSSDNGEFPSLIFASLEGELTDFFFFWSTYNRFSWLYP